MRGPSVEDVLAALKAHGSAELAAAIYADNDPAFVERLVDALTIATTDLATYPQVVVIAEANALLYQTLCDPIADAVPTAFTDHDSRPLAPLLATTAADAASTVDRLRATDADAARRLVASGLESWWTVEQFQVATCIRELLDVEVTPTRATVIAHATVRARQAMRPHHGTEPFVHSPAPALRPRILSPSPMALVPAWVARMDADPPPLDLAQDRIAYLRAAMSAMGRASACTDRLARITAAGNRVSRAPRPELTLA